MWLFSPGFQVQVMHLKQDRPAPLKSTTPPVFVISLFALTSSIMCSSSSSSRSAGLKMFLDWVSGKYKPPRLDFFLQALFGLELSIKMNTRVSFSHTQKERSEKILLEAVWPVWTYRKLILSLGQTVQR